MGNQHRGRRSYKGLMGEKVWGLYSEPEGGTLIGTCKARSREMAQDVFKEHNRRNPQFAMHGHLREVK